LPAPFFAVRVAMVDLLCRDAARRARLPGMIPTPAAASLVAPRLTVE